MNAQTPQLLGLISELGLLRGCENNSEFGLPRRTKLIHGDRGNANYSENTDRFCEIYQINDERLCAVRTSSVTFAATIYQMRGAEVFSLSFVGFICVNI